MLAEIFGMDGVVVVVIVLAVLFGGSQIPKLARSLGSARREFTEGLRHGESEHNGMSSNPTALAVRRETASAPAEGGSGPGT